MLQVKLCDDDEEILAGYARLIEGIAEKNGLEVQLRQFTNAQALLFAMEDAIAETDIVYLDVQMPGVNGVEAAKQLRALGCGAQIIFLTNSREYVFDSFDAAPLQYLLKDDVPFAKFEEVFLRAASLSQKREAELFHCERGAQSRAIPIPDITYFEVAKRIVTVHYDGGVFEFYSSMDELEKVLLQKGFVRTHRAFLVNVSRIRRLEQETVGLTSGEEVPLGRTHVKQVKEMLSQFLSGGGVG